MITTQTKIKTFLVENNGDLTNYSLRDIGEKIGIGRKKPQIIAHHLLQLEKKGLIQKRRGEEKKYLIYDRPREKPEMVYIKLYKTTAECGPQGYLGDDIIEDEIPIVKSSFHIDNPDNFFLVRARGDSMIPDIKSGDLVLARYQDIAENGDTVIAVHNKMPKIKKVEIKTTEEGFQEYNLVSTNKYPTEEINEDSEGRIVGLVRGVIRNY